jgi:2',3'-cyclic-nucleotide 2'-phosphodiesterase (5'-nucleotidase family)
MVEKWIRPVYFVIFIASLYLTACTGPRKLGKPADDGVIELSFLQVNDVYEIAPVSGGREGGMARVATIKKQLLQQNPNTFMIMAGDFLSPSVFNSLQYQGSRIRGKQMVEVMNAAGVDYAVFGNHEFDISESELLSRLNESKFRYISTNAFHRSSSGVGQFSQRADTATRNIPTFEILTLTDKDGTTCRLGIIGLTITSNKAAYVEYSDPFEAAKKVAGEHSGSCDVLIAITHLSQAEDVRLASEIPLISAILGGHEHDMRLVKQGNITITKAHANARSAYIVNLIHNRRTGKTTTKERLVMIDSTISTDPVTDSVVRKWTDIAAASYGTLGFDAKRILHYRGDSLEGRETLTRSGSTNFTGLIAASMLRACPDASAAIFNAGSVRLDDVLYPPISEYDILRSLPFGGSIREATMTGSLLVQILDSGLANTGTGGFLHLENIERHANEWQINGKLIDTAAHYRIALPEFLLSGLETRLEFLTEKHPHLIAIEPKTTDTFDPRSDIRLAIIRHLDGRQYKRR